MLSFLGLIIVIETGNNYLSGLEQPDLKPTIFFTPREPISNMSSELTRKYRADKNPVVFLVFSSCHDSMD